MKSAKGITMVALVVTIIILLILAGVVINLSIGNNGLFERAKIATNKYEESDENEKSQLGKLVNEMKLPDKEKKRNTVRYYIDIDISHEEEIEEGQSCLEPKTFNPEKEGWEFIGWREDENAQSQILTEKIMGENPINLYAVFKKDVTLSYNGNNAESGTVENQSGSVYYNASGNLEKAKFKISTNLYQKTASTFKFWGTEVNSTSGYQPESEISIEENTTLWARWNTQLFPNNLLFNATYYNGLTTPPSSAGNVSISKTVMSRTNVAGTYGDILLKASYDLTEYNKIYMTYKLTTYNALAEDAMAFWITGTPVVWRHSTAGTYTDKLDLSGVTGVKQINIRCGYWNFNISKIWAE